MNNLDSMANSRGCLVVCTATAIKVQTSTVQFISAIFVFLICILVSSTSAGDCWSERSSTFNTCKTLLRKNVSREQCCKYSGEGISWTNKSYSDSDIFKLTNLENGVPSCQPCRGESGQDSCDEIDCGPDKKCVMKSNKPRCVCSPNCTRTELEPRGVVCATDGRPYKNKCAMLKERCRTERNDVTVAYFGMCQKSCEGVTCREEQRCIEDQYGRPHCVDCHSLCPHTVQGLFVCGGDGITYESHCHLQRTACIQGVDTEMVHRGKCANLTTCDDLSCLENKQCVMDGDRPRCVICEFSCTGWRERGPLCASNNVTYNNGCHLQEYICNTTQYLQIEGYGICGDGDLYEIPDEYPDNNTDVDSILWRNLVGGTGLDIDGDLPDLEAYNNLTQYNSTEDISTPSDGGLDEDGTTTETTDIGHEFHDHDHDQDHPNIQ